MLIKIKGRSMPKIKKTGQINYEEGFKMPRKSSVDKEIVVKLFKDGLTYRAIALQLNSTEEAIRKIIKRNAPQELDKKKEKIKARNRYLESSKKEEFVLENKNLLSVQDRIELMNERKFGINTNESMGTYAFIKWNRHSYISDKKGVLHFDARRGGITKDVPKTYSPMIV